MWIFKIQKSFLLTPAFLLYHIIYKDGETERHTFLYKRTCTHSQAKEKEIEKAKSYRKEKRVRTCQQQKTDRHTDEVLEGKEIVLRIISSDSHALEHR